MLIRKTMSVYCCDSCGGKFIKRPIDGKCYCCDAVCGLCVFYNIRGFCEHNKSSSTCADRDSNYVCDIESFKPIAKEQ